ncbi:hypothetical protein ABPG72_022093 [Tetrahymena utriculariae]
MIDPYLFNHFTVPQKQNKSIPLLKNALLQPKQKVEIAREDFCYVLQSYYTVLYKNYKEFIDYLINTLPQFSSFILLIYNQDQNYFTLKGVTNDQQSSYFTIKKCSNLDLIIDQRIFEQNQSKEISYFANENIQQVQMLFNRYFFMGSTQRVYEIVNYYYKNHQIKEIKEVQDGYQNIQQFFFEFTEQMLGEDEELNRDFTQQLDKWENTNKELNEKQKAKVMKAHNSVIAMIILRSQAPSKIIKKFIRSYTFTKNV